MRLLAGDIGGTSTRLAWFEAAAPRPQLLAQAVFASRDFAGLDEVVAAFLAAHPGRADAACFGVAGPVRDGRVATPNLPWLVEAAVLAVRLDLPAVALINDLEANAHGIGALQPDDLRCLNRGQPAAGNACVIAAGTGLGEAGLYWDGCRHHPFATEGGHGDFAPRDDFEAALLADLRRRIGRVSVERIVSGAGIVAIYERLRAGGAAPEAAELARRFGLADPAAAIARAAADDAHPLAGTAVDRFVSLYGAEAGNLALKMLAVAGVYVGGGIAPRLLERLAAGGFMAAFCDKGRMRGLLEAMPVYVILDDRTALLGAARVAAGL